MQLIWVQFGASQNLHGIFYVTDVEDVLSSWQLFPSLHDGLSTRLGIFPAILYPEHVGDDDDICGLRLHISLIFSNPPKQFQVVFKSKEADAKGKVLKLLLEDSLGFISFLLQPQDDMINCLFLFDCALLQGQIYVISNLGSLDYFKFSEGQKYYFLKVAKKTISSNFLSCFRNYIHYGAAGGINRRIVQRKQLLIGSGNYKSTKVDDVIFLMGEFKVNFSVNFSWEVWVFVEFKVQCLGKSRKDGFVDIIICVCEVVTNVLVDGMVGPSEEAIFDLQFKIRAKQSHNAQPLIYRTIVFRQITELALIEQCHALDILDKDLTLVHNHSLQKVEKCASLIQVGYIVDQF